MRSDRSRVALILTAPGWRGSGVSFLKIAQGLSSLGHRVRVLAGSDEVAARMEAGGMEVDLVPAGDTGWREVGRTGSLLRKHRVGTVMCDRPRDVRLAHYSSLGKGRRIIWRYNLHSRHLASDILQRWIFRSVSHVVHQSRYSSDRFLADSPWLAGLPASVIPNGFDAAALHPDSDRGRAMRSRLEINDDRLVVVTPTPDYPEKEIATAHAAVRQAATQVPITWVVTADIDAHRSAALDVLPVGRLEPDDYIDLIRASDLVLLAGRRELFCNVAAESMALGAVVVAPDAGATTEVVGQGGVLFRPGDFDAAAGVIVGLAGDPGRRTSLSEAARQRITAEFSLDAMQRRFERLVAGSS